MNAQKGFTLIELMIVVAIIGILAAIAIPQYQNYITKSQVSRVMAETGNYKTAVEDCVNAGKVTGNAAGECTIADLGLTGSNLLGTAVKIASANGVASPAVEVLDTGAATIVGTFGNNASANLKTGTAKTLTWTRTVDGTWSCATTVPSKYVPSGCTGDAAAAAANPPAANPPAANTPS